MVELKRVAGYGTIICLTIGSVIGTGLFMGPALGAQIAGPASLISWAILALLSIYIASCFGELVAMYPRAGGIYEFSKQTYGRFFSFIIGWLTWLVGNITAVVLIVTGVNYLLPDPGLVWLKVGISFVFLLLLNLITLLGIEGSSMMVIIFTFITLAVIISVAVPGLGKINPANFSPFFTKGYPPIILTIFFIAESFFGWEAASYLAEETKNPEKVIPLSLVISTVIVSLLSLAAVVAMLGIIPASTLATSSAPFLDTARSIYSSMAGANLSYVLDGLSLGIYLTMLGSAAGVVVTMPRLILALARDKLFLKQFTEIHPKFATPYKAIVFQFVASIFILLIGFGNYETLLSLLVPLSLAMYSFVLLCIPILRFTRPETPRPFRALFGKFLPFLVVGFFITVVLLWAVNIPNSLSLLGMCFSLIFLGIPLYFLIGIYNDPHMIEDVNDLLAYFTLITERINFPNSVIREIMSHMGDLSGKEVLEYGCGVGTLTVRLAEAVGSDGTVVATSFSKNHIKITKRRIDRAVWRSERRVLGRVRLIHDIEHTSRVHPEVGMVQAAVSVGMIGYTQEIEKVLREMNQLMPEGGKICFVDYGDFFHVIPNVDWLANNQKIEKIFRDCGFSVQVKRKRGLFWSYIFIYGMKYRKNVTFI